MNDVVVQETGRRIKNQACINNVFSFHKAPPMSFFYVICHFDSMFFKKATGIKYFISQEKSFEHEKLQSNCYVDWSSFSRAWGPSGMADPASNLSLSFRFKNGPLKAHQMKETYRIPPHWRRNRCKKRKNRSCCLRPLQIQCAELTATWSSTIGIS